MKIEKISSDNFKKIFNQNDFIYNTVDFNIINKEKCDQLDFLLIYDNKRQIGLIGGHKDRVLKSPFSASFSCFSMNNNIRFEYIAKALQLLDEYALSQELRAIDFVLPPYFYDENLISRIALCLNDNGYSSSMSVNHHLYTADLKKYDSGEIAKEIRYSIRTAIKHDLVFKLADNEEEMSLAFEVIEINKKSKNRSQSMTFEQVLEMRKIIGIDFLLIYKDEKPLASAVIYNHNPVISQVIYWGALPDTSQYYPMNFLAYNILKYYAGRNTTIVDLGTSMIGDEFHTGLINFKDSIGAKASVKLSFSKNLLK